MMEGLFIVTQVAAVESVASTKNPGETIARQGVVLRRLGGQYADSFTATCLGGSVVPGLVPGLVVAASLDFTIREYNGRMYQDCLVREMKPLA